MQSCEGIESNQKWPSLFKACQARGIHIHNLVLQF